KKKATGKPSGLVGRIKKKKNQTPKNKSREKQESETTAGIQQQGRIKSQKRVVPDGWAVFRQTTQNSLSGQNAEPTRHDLHPEASFQKGKTQSVKKAQNKEGQKIDNAIYFFKPIKGKISSLSKIPGMSDINEELVPRLKQEKSSQQKSKEGARNAESFPNKFLGPGKLDGSQNRKSKTQYKSQLKKNGEAFHQKEASEERIKKARNLPWGLKEMDVRKHAIV
ncbi:hypothetical protein EBT16_10465, partial [bacterium]|nr:hypothetical protein [bacterium]